MGSFEAEYGALEFGRVLCDVSSYVLWESGERGEERGSRERGGGGRGLMSGTRIASYGWRKNVRVNGLTVLDHTFESSL